MYLLDTNTISELMKQNSHTWECLLSQKPKDVFMCEVVVSEILFGLQLLKDSKKKRLLQKEFLPLTETIQIAPWDRETSYKFAEIKSNLFQKGKLITDLDIIIAAHAQRYDYILVTDNIKDFERISKLKIINWK